MKTTRRPRAAPRRARRPRSLALVLAAVLGLAASAPGADPASETRPDSADITASVTLPGPGQQEVLPAVKEPFRAGESLRFNVRYGIIHAGDAWLEVPRVRDWQGHGIYELVARAQSNSFFDKVYKVRNRIESWWDHDGRFSRRYLEDRREGRYRQKTDIQFDADRREAHYLDGQVFPVPPRVQDALSAFYYARTQALPLGGSFVFDYHASRKSQPLLVKVLGRERVSVPAGTFDCVAIEPILKAGGIFKNTGRLVIWLTDDERRMPVLMKSKVLIGSIDAVLVEARPGA